MGDNNNKPSGEHIINWFYEPETDPKFKLDSLEFGRVKGFLYHAAHRCVTKHNLHECYQLLKTLPKEVTVDPYILYRLILILLESSPNELIHQNAILYLETMLSSIDLAKLDVFLEFLIFLIRHERIEDAKALFSLRSTYIARISHKPLPIARLNISCYELLLNYLEWNDKEIKNKFDESIQGWIVNAIVSLKETKSNHEYFVTSVVKVLLHYKYYKKAYIFVSQFQRNNPHNIGIQLFFKKLLEHLSMISSLDREQNDETAMICDTSEEELQKNWTKEFEALNNFSLAMDNESFEPESYPIEDDRKRIFDNLKRLDPTREEIVEMLYLNNDLIESIKNLMDGLEFINEMKNIDRWLKVKAVINELDDRGLMSKLKSLWEQRYKRIWEETDFIHLSNANVEGQRVINQVLNKLKSLNAGKPKPHQFYCIPDYCRPGYIDSCPSEDSP